MGRKAKMLGLFLAAAITAAGVYVPQTCNSASIQAEAKTSSRKVTFEGISWKIPDRYRYDKKATDDVTLGMKELKSRVYTRRSYTDRNGEKVMLMPPQKLQFDIVDAVASKESAESLGYTVSNTRIAGYKAVKWVKDEIRDDGGKTHQVIISFKKGKQYYTITAENISGLNSILRSAKKARKKR